MSKKTRSKSLFFILFFAGIFLLIFLNNHGYLNFVKNSFIKVSSPFQDILNSMSNRFGYFGQIIFQAKYLKAENEKLLLSYQEALGKIVQYEEIKAENNLLRKQLGFEENKKNVLLLADVIGRDPLVFGRTILINKGSGDGIKKQMPAIVAGNILIGQVVEVSDSTAKVRLLSDISSKVPVFIQNSRLDGLVKGDGTLALNLELVPKEIEMKSGELIISSNLGGIYPKGLFIGTVASVSSADNQFFQKAVISPAVNYQKLESIFVILNLQE